MTSVNRKRLLDNNEDKNEDKNIENIENKHKHNDMFICGICKEYMVLPVTIMCGHNFCKECLIPWVELKNSKWTTCPVCRTKSHVNIETLGVNKTLKSCIKRQINDGEFAKRYKKSTNAEKYSQFINSRYKKSSRYKKVKGHIYEIFETCNGVIKYQDLIGNVSLSIYNY